MQRERCVMDRKAGDPMGLEWIVASDASHEAYELGKGWWSWLEDEGPEGGWTEAAILVKLHGAWEDAGDVWLARVARELASFIATHPDWRLREDASGDYVMTEDGEFPTSPAWCSKPGAWEGFDCYKRVGSRYDNGLAKGGLRRRRLVRQLPLREVARVDLTALLYPYQKAGAEYLRARRHALLADQMGLGKTVQALAALPDAEGAVIVCPASLIDNWKREIARFRPELVLTDEILPRPGEVHVTAYSRLPRCSLEVGRLGIGVRLERSHVVLASVEVNGPAERAGLRAGDVLHALQGEPILSPEDLRDWLGLQAPGASVFVDVERTADGARTTFLVELGAPKDDFPRWIGAKPAHPFTLIDDEAQLLKNPHSTRTRRARALASVAARVWLLTGTPLPNRPEELWTVLQAAQYSATKVFGSREEFERIFSATKEKRWGSHGAFMETTWGDPLPEARERLDRFMLRRTRAEVLPELPDKTLRMFPVLVARKGLLGQDFHFIDSWTDERVAEESQEGGSLFAVRRELAEAKHLALGELLETFRDADEPVVVFSQHKVMPEALAVRPGWAAITGDTRVKDRDVAVRAFQDGKLEGLAGTIGAMGVGHTLTRAAHVVFVDRSFVPAENLQAEDRLCRIGQTRGVLVTVLIADHPVDRRVEEIIAKKTRLLEQTNLL